ncbi:MAG: spore germination protein [Lachnospirales bacterium]
MKLTEKVNLLKSKLPIDTSYDVLSREILIGETSAYFIFVDGFAKDDILYYFLENIQNYKGDIKNLSNFFKNQVAYIESEEVKDDKTFDNLVVSVLSGMFAIVFEEYENYFLLDTRNYPVRSITESEVEKVVRGARDSFVETIVFNTALIRRRIRVADLIFDMQKVGNNSKTDIVISYIDSKVDKKLLNNVKNMIKDIDTEALILGAEYIEEFLFNKKWYNPLPMVKYTERPDVAAAYLIEGHIAIIIDSTPVAIILPVNIFTFTQHIGDYNLKTLNGTIVKIFRFFSILLATFFAPIFIYLSDHTKYFENLFEKINKSSESPEALLSFFMQILILEILFFILQTSAIHIPKQIAPMISIIGGLMLGDIAIKAGVFTSVSLLVMLATVICTYNIPSIELSDALRIFRLFMIIATGFFGGIGLLFSFVLILIIIFGTKNIDGAKRYTYPLFPFNLKHLLNLIFKRPINKVK